MRGERPRFGLRAQLEIFCFVRQTSTSIFSFSFYDCTFLEVSGANRLERQLCGVSQYDNP